ncbi:HAD-IB family hydrolase [Halomonas denitrificans]|uniref:HAD-IB family hydrolase n=1 Tax=Halomonas denitrificans TaxID=370769 RepID=UPI000D37E378|nr:HAD-IB family hydrolase [Halomonas denitrificans]
MGQLTKSDTRPVAFFDFDGTLTIDDSLMPFLKYVVGTPTYYAKLALVSPVRAALVANLLRNDIAKQIFLRQYLAGYHIDDLFEQGQRFSEEVIPTMLRPEGIERLRRHQEKGHECVLVSASMDLYLSHWSKMYGFSESLCSTLSTGSGVVVSRSLVLKNCHGEEKCERISCCITDLTQRESYAYGDSSEDLPMLHMVDNGFMLTRGEFFRVRRSS